MRKLFTALFLFFTICIYTTSAKAQGVGAGGFNPAMLGLTDTCNSTSYFETEVTIEPDYWYFYDKPPYENPFSAFPSTSSNGLYVDGNYWSSILADTLGKTYDLVYSFHTDSIDMPICSPDTVLLRLYIVIDSLSTLDPENNSIHMGGSLACNYVGIQGDTLVYCEVNTTWSAIAAMDSILLLFAWGSGISFDIDGAAGLIQYDSCVIVSNVGMKVFVENCDPIETQDISVKEAIENQTDTLLTALIQPCLPIGKNEMFFCEGTNDTLVFNPNTYHSVTVYPDTLNSVFYVGNLSGSMIPSNRELHYQAPECKLLTERILLYCNETNSIIVTIK